MRSAFALCDGFFVNTRLSLVAIHIYRCPRIFLTYKEKVSRFSLTNLKQVMLIEKNDLFHLVLSILHLLEDMNSI